MTQKTSALFLRIISYLMIVNAVIWGLAPFDQFNAPAHFYLDLLDWPLGDAPAELGRNAKWLSAIGAGLLMALAILLLGVICPALEAGEKRTIRVTVMALIAWFVIDSAGSIAAGVPANVFFNLVYLIPMLVPLLFVRWKSDLGEVGSR